MQQGDISIRCAQETELNGLRALVDALGIARDVDYFEKCFALQAEGKRDILIAALGGRDVGYCMLNWAPKYNVFKKLGIAEIQDLNVLRDVRRRGIGRALIEHCEGQAVARGFEFMGIAVGLNTSFGAAQRLYVQLGYVPDGNGVTYDRRFVEAGDAYPIDDDLCLMMIKSFV